MTNPKPTDPSIGEAVEREGQMRELARWMSGDGARKDDDPPFPVHAANIRAILSENAQLRERVGVLEGAMWSVQTQAANAVFNIGQDGSIYGRDDYARAFQNIATATRQALDTTP